MSRLTTQAIVAAYRQWGDVLTTAEQLGRPADRVAAAVVQAGEPVQWLPGDVTKQMKTDYPFYARIGAVGRMAVDYGWSVPFLKARLAELGELPDRLAWNSASDSAIRAVFEHYGSVSLGAGQYAAKFDIPAAALRQGASTRWPDEWEATAAGKVRKSRGAALGRDTENRLRKKLEGLGWLSLRSAGSRGAVDLAVVKAGRILFIQVKRSGVLGPAGWNALWEAAEKAGAEPVLAENPYPGCWRLWLLTDRKRPNVCSQPMRPLELDGWLAPVRRTPVGDAPLTVGAS